LHDRLLKTEISASGSSSAADAKGRPRARFGAAFKKAPDARAPAIHTTAMIGIEARRRGAD